LQAKVAREACQWREYDLNRQNNVRAEGADYALIIQGERRRKHAGNNKGHRNSRRNIVCAAAITVIGEMKKPMPSLRRYF
jgi:hypothetical protein